MERFEQTYKHKLIYVFSIPYDTHKGLLKVGDATLETDLKPDELLPLASYWFYVKEDCSLHFAIAAEETPSPEAQ